MYFCVVMYSVIIFVKHSGTKKWSELEIEDPACVEFMSLPPNLQGKDFSKQKRSKIKDVCMFRCTVSMISFRLNCQVSLFVHLKKFVFDFATFWVSEESFKPLKVD
jgi:hypothetical protein